MNKYTDRAKQRKLDDIMRNRRSITFSDLQQLENDGIIEDYDLFRVLSEHFERMYVFYLDGEYNIVTRDRKSFRQIDKEMLHNRRLLLSRCITNGIQNFMQYHGEKALYQLSTEEFIQELLNQDESLFLSENEIEER